jgi:Transposase DDE domain
MSQRQPKCTKPVCSAQIRDVILKVVQQHVPLAVAGGDPDDSWLWEILLYASVNGTTIESACNELRDAPSGNTTREYLQDALADRRQKVVALEQQLNAALRAQLPKRITKRLARAQRFEIAMDLHDIPYHGQPSLNENEIRRGVAKSGTTHFHSYATLALVHNDRRYEVALTFVWADETMAQVVERLLAAKNSLNLRVRRAYLDKGFCGESVFARLRAHRLSYIIPIPLRGKQLPDGTYVGGIGRLFIGQRSYDTRYTFNEGQPAEYTTEVALARTYSRGRYGRHGATWFAYAVYGLEHICPNPIFNLYRRRFGIESGYRQLEQVRARTSSKCPALRLLLVGLALLILNTYMTLRRVWLTIRYYGQRVRYLWLTLKRLALWLARLLEQLYGVRPLKHSISVKT